MELISRIRPLAMVLWMRRTFVTVLWAGVVFLLLRLGSDQPGSRDVLRSGYLPGNHLYNSRDWPWPLGCRWLANRRRGKHIDHDQWYCRQ
jgi:hypothetical protein